MNYDVECFLDSHKYQNGSTKVSLRGVGPTSFRYALSALVLNHGSSAFATKKR